MNGGHILLVVPDATEARRVDVVVWLERAVGLLEELGPLVADIVFGGGITLL